MVFLSGQNFCKVPLNGRKLLWLTASRISVCLCLFVVVLSFTQSLSSPALSCTLSSIRQPWELPSREDCGIDLDIYSMMGSERDFCMRTLGALGVLKEDEWVIIFTNCQSVNRRDSVGFKAANCVGNFQLLTLILFTLKSPRLKQPTKTGLSW